MTQALGILENYIDLNAQLKLLNKVKPANLVMGLVNLRDGKKAASAM